MRPSPIHGVTARARTGIALASLAMACATTRQDEMTSLKRSVEGYNEAFRWKNYPLAAAFLPAEERSAFVAAYEEEDKALHVEGYQILDVTMLSPEAATVSVRYRFMLLPSVTLERRTVTQHWARLKGRWRLEHEDDSIRPLRPTDEPTTADEAASGTGFGGEPPAEATVEVEVIGPDGEVVGRRREGPGVDDTD